MKVPMCVLHVYMYSAQDEVKTSKSQEREQPLYVLPLYSLLASHKQVKVSRSGSKAQA